MIRLMLAVATAAALMASPVLGEEEKPWFPSKWGADDTLGAMNYLEPRNALEATKLVKLGKAIPLGIVVGPKTPAYPPRGFNLQIVQPGQVGGTMLGDKGMVYNDEILHTWLGIGSQIDGLGHVGINHIYYNGAKAQEFSAPTGLTRFGVHNLPPIATRGVMLDIAALRGVEMMREGDAITPGDIDAAAERQGISIREGDVVLFHTGWLDIIEKDPKRFSEGEPGLSVEGAKHLVEKGVVAIGADNWALEVIPFAPGSGVFEVHQTLLAKNGTYILENMNTGLLKEAGVNEFMFVLGVPRIQGAVQMIVNPVALY